MKLVRAKEGYRKVGDKYLLAKKCTKCGKWLVANADNFRRSKGGKYGVRGECKKCEKKLKKQYREANREKELERCKQWRENNKEKIAKKNKQYYEANKEKILEYNKQWRETNKDKAVKYSKQYRENNKDKIAEKQKQYYETNKEKIVERQKQWNEANRDKTLEYHKQYYETNKEKIAERRKQYRQTLQGQVAVFNRTQRRRIREEQQGSGITKDQWLEMMKFFDFRCAYSGETLSKKTRSIDHIVPLNSGGEHEIWNMVPMLRNLNSSKCAKDMLDWYKEQDFYSEARLAKIYEWQEYARKKWEIS